jgi:hypothetical protein
MEVTAKMVRENGPYTATKTKKKKKKKGIFKKIKIKIFSRLPAPSVQFHILFRHREREREREREWTPQRRTTSPPLLSSRLVFTETLLCFSLAQCFLLVSFVVVFFSPSVWLLKRLS